jgi:hypothetical protein
MWSGTRWKIDAKMDQNVADSIALGVPVWVSTYTASSTTDDGLPSWKTTPHDHCLSWANKKKTVCGLWNGYHSLAPGGHAIAVVGYDSDYYYYIDTCGNGQWGSLYLKCRHGPRDDAYQGKKYQTYHWTGSTYSHVWRIAKSSLYDLMWDYGKYGGAYLSYAGDSGHAAY